MNQLTAGLLEFRAFVLPLSITLMGLFGWLSNNECFFYSFFWKEITLLWDVSCMCAESSQLKGSMASVFRCVFRVSVRTTRPRECSNHEARSWSRSNLRCSANVAELWPWLVALRYTQLQIMSVYFSPYFNTHNGEAHQQFFAKHSCACVAVVFTSYDSDQTLAISLAQPDCLSSPLSSPPARLHYSAEETSGRTTWSS